MEGFDEHKIICNLQEFLDKSSRKYSGEVSQQVSDLAAFNGNFWTNDLRKKFRRSGKNKFCLHFSDWGVLSNAIVSPYSSSPWHINVNNADELQEGINTIEEENDNKYSLKEGLRRSTICGAGFIVVTTEADELTKEPKIVLEFVQNQESVALDPSIQRPDCSDAEEGAIVNYISISKAKRLYGNDIVSPFYPEADNKLSFKTITQWPNKEDNVQIVSYYKKNESGTVDYYKVCGNKVVEHIELPIRYIPIVRFAGYMNYDGYYTKYSGIVAKTFDLQVSLNIAYSTLMERANRSIKANVLASTAAVKNLDKYYEKKEDEDGSMILFNEGATVPTVLTEQFATGDLSDVINNLRTLIADVVGIPLSGILGAENKTATEILVQQSNKESNVAIFYDNAYKACRTIGRIIIELLNGGSDMKFDLENGPDVITNNMKHRQELTAVANLIPAELQPLVAVKMCDTIDSKFIDGIKQDIIANLPENVKLTKQGEDPYAIHTIQQLQAQLNQAMDNAEQMQAENAEMKQQIAGLNLELMNRKQQQSLDLLKHEDQMKLDVAKLEMEAQQNNVDVEVEQQKGQVELQKQILELEKKKAELENTYMKQYGGV